MITENKKRLRTKPKELSTKKLKKKRNKVPFLSVSEFFQWSEQSFTLSLILIISRLREYCAEYCASQDIENGSSSSNVFLDLARLFNGLQKQSQEQSQEQSQVHFVHQAQTLGVDQYIDVIVKHKQIPLKPNSNHDLMNAFMWLSLPKTRSACAQAMLQARQYRDISNLKQRCKLEDRFTLFDESGVAIFSDDFELITLVKARAWKELFYIHAQSCQKHLKLWIVGHGLYEQLLNPFVGLVAYGRCYHVEPSVFQEPLESQVLLFDQMIAQDLKTQLGKQELELSAIPILGYPGWWPDQSEMFYENSRYFRGPYPKSANKGSL